MDENENLDKSCSTSMDSKDEKKVKKKNVKRCGKRSSNVSNEKVSIPIFTDAFLDLFRKQKSEIRSLKLTYSQLSERFKFKDAQQEQIRLDNQKMRLDIEEISQKNSFFKNQINRIEQEFKERFQQDINQEFLASLRQHYQQQDYQNQIEKIHKYLQF